MFSCCQPEKTTPAFSKQPTQPIKPTYTIYPQLPLPPCQKPLPPSILEQISIKNQQNKLFVRTDLNNTEFRAEDCENCSFIILDTVRAVTADRCKNCAFFVVVAGSIFLRECENFSLSAIAKQLRLRGSSGVSASLVKTAPVVENCSGIEFGPFKVQFDVDMVGKVQELQGVSGVDPQENKFDQVYDFTAEEGNAHFVYNNKLEGVKIETVERDFLEGELAVGLQGHMISNCGMPIIQTGEAKLGLNLQFEVVQIISEMEELKIAKLVKIDEKQRKKLSLSKKTYDFYVLIFGDVKEAESQIQKLSQQFLVLDDGDFKKIKDLVV